MSLYLEIWKVAIEFLVAVSPAIVGWPMMRRANSGLSFFFGAVIGLVGCYKGYNAGRGTESVGVAANSAVVLASLLVIIVDMIAVQITDMML